MYEVTERKRASCHGGKHTGLQDAAAFHQSHSDLDSFVGQVRSHDVFVVCERLLTE